MSGMPKQMALTEGELLNSNSFDGIDWAKIPKAERSKLMRQVRLSNKNKL